MNMGGALETCASTMHLIMNTASRLKLQLAVSVSQEHAGVTKQRVQVAKRTQVKRTS